MYSRDMYYFLSFFQIHFFSAYVLSIEKNSSKHLNEKIYLHFETVYPILI